MARTFTEEDVRAAAAEVAARPKRKPPTAAQRNARTRARLAGKLSAQRQSEALGRIQARTVAKGRETQERIELTGQARAAREQAQRSEGLEKQAQVARERRVNRVQGAIVGSAVGAPAGAVASSSGAGNIILIIGFFFALIIVYNLVTKASATAGFFGTLGKSIGMLSQNTPLFVKKAQTTS